MSEEVDAKLKSLSTEFQQRVESNQRMIMGVRGEVNILSEQLLSNERKTDELRNEFNVSLKTLAYKIDRDDLMRINTRFRDFVPYYEYNELLKNIELLAMQKDMNFALQRINELQNEINCRYTIEQVNDIVKVTTEEIK